jgi:FkbM family methyltransferase
MALKTKFLNFLRRPLANELIDRPLAAMIERFPSSVLLRKAAPGPLLYKKGSQRIAKRFGVDFELDLSDYPGWSLYFHSPADSSRGVLQFVKEGDTVLDIGGNIGQTALLLAKKVGDRGTVISFEPFPDTIGRFERNLQLNPNVQNVELEKFGLGSKKGSIQMCQDSANNSAGNRVINSAEELTSGVTEIKVELLDNYISTAQLEKVDLIKIDVEGYEMSVLHGATKTLRQYKPKLFVEVSDPALRKQGSSSEELVEFIQNLGYTATDMATLKPITSGSELGRHTDIFCNFPQNV